MVGLIVGISLFLTGCAHAPPPENPHNICNIFQEKEDWYHEAKKSTQRWGTPIPVMMSIMYHESSYVANARPPRRWYWGFIPGPRISTAYGYAQALDGVWDDYRTEIGAWGDRDEFADAVDFIGWYTNKSLRINGVKLSDARNQYLNYHEGWGGYQRRTYRRKPWLMGVAKRVEKKAKRYRYQLKQCEEELNKPSFWQWLFG
ncbi:hypothetical protein H0A36_05475 [Endozoicomonas sp. SM1973]|uniref:Transglycosylase SLT domain-containing protein n=1 Tax=Spartinivicinus marinus TaxID=2994442 RepID=A0A853I1W6_9GAMM|nr:hypothetical protein [Spartinivicinus marinus]MCX4028965.1 hypothetical protein [Spartinivicinus marinus]NYZ65452.1 hypothetical protein [Spartinivicinus marinus]